MTGNASNASTHTNSADVDHLSSANSELINHLLRHTRLTADEASKIIQETLAFFDETPTHFIRRRHHELQKSGMTNAAIYQLVSQELDQRRFRATPMSERQIRRAIYG